MNDEQWKRLNSYHSAERTSIDRRALIDRLKHRQTFLKYKSTGHSYARVYFLNSAEDAIFYFSRKHKARREACQIKDIEQVRHGFTTAVWKKCLEKGKIEVDKSKFALSILYDNSRHSLDLLADSKEIAAQWIESLEYLLALYQSHLRAHHPITDRWIWYLFSRADQDRSGQLNRGEVRRLLFILNIDINERTCDQYFNQANIRTNNYEQLRNLDKDEFLRFYKFISFRPELVRIICQYNGSTNEETEALLSEFQTIQKMAETLPLQRPRGKSLISFRRRRRALPTVEEIENKKNYLTAEQLKDFLQKDERMSDLSLEDSCKLIARFEPSSEGQEYEQMGVDGFRLLLLHDEFCLMNPNKSHRIYHDMTRPLTDYFIATSHNTYLRDNQVYGHCTPETVIHALRTGCRAIELDCYDGENLEPIVYHANTLTKPITFREVIHAIEPQAFSVSPYPLFLNLENHCSYEQQYVMARILKGTFGDKLLDGPLQENFQALPSPEDLKYKVIIRSRRYPKRKIRVGEKTNQNDDEAEPNPKGYHPDFANLIIYAQIISYTHLNRSMSAQRCFHSVSLKESKVDELIEANSSARSDLIKLTQQHLIRVYPRTKRQNSSNFDPAIYWIHGIQMVALNYQSNDESMCLQHGLFSDNGGCGYLLKPACLLSEDEPFDPKSKVRGREKHLEIHVISGQHLPKEDENIYDRDISDPYVEVSTFGVQTDHSTYRTPAVRNNGLNPIWDHRIKLTIACPELCLVKFQVRDEDRFGRSTFLGQAALPFNTMQLGYRHLKLKAKNGDFIHGTLFVHIKINE